jgi:sulfofructose kinase
MASVLCVGHAVQDFVFAVDRLPDRGEKYRAREFESVGGGPAATAAVTIARLGGRARLAARVGDDAIADVIARELEAFGVDCTWVRRFSGAWSSVSAVMVDPRGERMIVNHLDARMPGAADWLPSIDAAGADAVLADTRWPEGAARALAAARAAGIPGILDGDRPIPRDASLLASASHVAFSMDGLAELTGEADPARALALAAAAHDAWRCVTLGADGVLVQDARGTRRVPAFGVRAVDTLGAGDVWHGAFALALAEGRGEDEAVRQASAAAALKVQRFGGRAGVPTRAEVDAFLGTP